MEHKASSMVLEEGNAQQPGKGEEAKEVGEENRQGDCRIFTFENHEVNCRYPTSAAILRVHKVKPKLCSTRAVYSSSQESTQSLTEPQTKSKSPKPWEATEPHIRPCEHLDPDQNQVDVSEGKAEEQKGNREGERKSTVEKQDSEEVDLGKEMGGGEPRRSISEMRDKKKDKWKVRGRERLLGSVEAEVGDMERTERLRSKQWIRTGREQEGKEVREESEIKGSGELDEAWKTQVEHGLEQLSEGDIERRGSMRRTILSRMLMHSSASSSSSSFNCSSAESDEVFSEGEDTMARRQTMKKSRSWKTFLAMMQCEAGEVLKLHNAVESSCLQALMSDSLRQFVPCYHGLTIRGSESYIRLDDLLSGLTCPVIMDCKMGVRTYLEEELARARSSSCPRTDMYQKMIKVDPEAPSAEEHAQGGLTKLRYMQWRDSVSSTSTLGFRIEGVAVEDGRVLRDFKKTRTSAQVTDVFLSFTKRQANVLEAYLSRLQALNEALKDSEFFKTHEVIGSSLLFVHDRTNKANIWMIDFGKTTPTPSGLHLKHNIPWVEGNREDGYIIGLTNLTWLVTEALRQALGQDHDVHNIPVHIDHQPDTQSGSWHSEVIHNPIQNLQLGQSSVNTVETGVMPNDAMSETQGCEP
ncbi:hypothetical protein JZ751_006792 [Albula glossodonta]|uniref:Kinase n=1 Tax=Albula glossodonta TaxID=121402 RepID=A0A8T2P5C6_9TELE|nr:hypothetical protein JZ751_006792 [Albula glossodonta]